MFASGAKINGVKMEPVDLHDWTFTLPEIYVGTPGYVGENPVDDNACVFCCKAVMAVFNGSAEISSCPVLTSFRLNGSEKCDTEMPPMP